MNPLYENAKWQILEIVATQYLSLEDIYLKLRPLCRRTKALADGIFSALPERRINNQIPVTYRVAAYAVSQDGLKVSVSISHDVAIIELLNMKFLNLGKDSRTFLHGLLNTFHYAKQIGNQVFTPVCTFHLGTRHHIIHSENWVREIISAFYDHKICYVTVEFHGEQTLCVMQNSKSMTVDYCHNIHSWEHRERWLLVRYLDKSLEPYSFILDLEKFEVVARRRGHDVILKDSYALCKKQDGHIGVLQLLNEKDLFRKRHSIDPDLTGPWNIQEMDAMALPNSFLKRKSIKYPCFELSWMNLLRVSGKQNGEWPLEYLAFRAVAVNPFDISKGVICYQYP